MRWLRGVAEWDAALARTHDRLAWLERDDWLDDIMEPAEEDERTRYTLALANFRLCREIFDRETGRAPTSRLQRAARAYREACKRYRGHAERVQAAFDALDEDLFYDSYGLYMEGDRIIDATDGSLPPGSNQPLPERGGTTKGSRVEPEFSRVAGRVAVKDVEVRCWSPRDWHRVLQEEGAFSGDPFSSDVLGYAKPGGTRVHLSPVTCGRLMRVRYGRARPSDPDDMLDVAIGIGTLAHEATHSAGYSDEGVTECYAVQLVERTAWALGVKPAYARRLAEAYWDDYGSSLPEYRSKDCRNGGPLDLRKRTDTWP